MLVFERQRYERTLLIVPPSDTETRIVIDVPRIKPTSVRLAIDAPREVKIIRDDAKPPRPADDSCGVGPDYGEPASDEQKPSTVNLRRPA